MRTAIVLSLLLCLGIGKASFGQAAPEEKPLPPYVVATVPADRAVDVDPRLKQVRVTFDRPMKTEQSWSWMTYPSLGRYPGMRKGPDPVWEDNGRTCVLAVDLRSDTVYAIGVNGQRNSGFVDTSGAVAVPYVWVFRTR